MFVTCTAELMYENERGMGAKLAPFSLFWLQSCKEDTENIINSEPQSGIDGEIPISMRLSVRHMALSGFIDDVPNMEYHKSTLERVFNPTLSGRLTYRNVATAETLSLDVKVDAIPEIVWSDKQARFDIELTALNPYWIGQEVREQIALLSKLFKFPLRIPSKAQGGFVFGRRRLTLDSIFENVGDVATGFRAVFRARGGTVAGPMIENKNTGAFVRMRPDLVLQPGDMLEMAIFPNIKRIVLNGSVNAFAWMDTSSDFFTLPTGTNHLAYSAAENVSNLDVVVYYVPRFLGV